MNEKWIRVLSVLGFVFASSAFGDNDPNNPVTACFNLQFQNYTAYVECINDRRRILDEFTAKWHFDPNSEATPCYNHLPPGPQRQQCAADLAAARQRGNDIQTGIESTISIIPPTAVPTTPTPIPPTPIPPTEVPPTPPPTPVPPTPPPTVVVEPQGPTTVCRDVVDENGQHYRDCYDVDGFRDWMGKARL